MEVTQSKLSFFQVAVEYLGLETDLISFIIWQKRVENLKQSAFENFNSWEICEEDHDTVPQYGNLHLGQGSLSIKLTCILFSLIKNML